MRNLSFLLCISMIFLASACDNSYIPANTAPKTEAATAGVTAATADVIDRLVKMIRLSEETEEQAMKTLVDIARDETDTTRQNRAVGIIVEAARGKQYCFDRAQAVHALGMLDGEDALTALRSLLYDSRADIRAAAAYELTLHQDYSGFDILLECLYRDYGVDSIVIVQTLGKINDTRSLDALNVLIQQNSRPDDFLFSVIDALEQSKTERAEDVLYKAILSSQYNAPVRKYAMEALRRLNADKADAARLDVLRFGYLNDFTKLLLEELVLCKDEKQLDRMIEATVSAIGRNYGYTIEAINALARNGSPQAVKKLLVLVRANNITNSIDLLLDAAELITNAEAVDSLIAAAKDRNTYVRSFVAVALGATGDARAIKPLKALAKDRDGAVRGWAQTALSKFKDGG